MVNLKRIYSIDLIKTIATILVVGLHTLRGSLGGLNYIFFQLGIISIPMFFLVNGFLLFKKDKISYRYILFKIIKILKIMVFWEFTYTLAYFLVYHQLRNFLESVILDFIQKGLFYHFWFFGALIIFITFVTENRN